MVDTVDTIITRFVVEGTDAAIEKARELSTQIESVKVLLVSMQKETGLPFKTLAEGLKQSGEAFMHLGISASNSTKVTNMAVSELTKNATQATNVFTKMGQAIQYAFGLGLYQVINRVTRAIEGAVEVAIDYAEALTILAVSTRALQRTGSQITFKEVIQEVRQLKAMFPIFTTKEAVEAVGFTQLVTRNFRFTNEEMMKTLKIAAGLSVVLGKDLQVASRELALFLSSGYAESMQRAGFAVNRLAVVEEAHRMGINKTYMAMTEVERSHAALALMERQFITVEEDINKIMEQQYYKLKQTQKAWEEFTNTLSLRFLPIIAFLSDGIKQLVSLIAVLANVWFATVKAMAEEAKLYLAFDPKNFLDKQEKIIEQWGKDMTVAVKSYFGENPIELPLGDAMMGAFQDLDMTAEEEMTKLKDMVNDIDDEIKHNDEQFKIDMKNAETDYWRDIDDIVLDNTRKLEELWTEHRRREDDLLAKSLQRSNELQIDYGHDVIDANAELDAKITEQNEKYRDKELKAEADFQEKLLRLREEFELDLEDAVRERDARQIMRLMRRYNLEQVQLRRAREQQILENQQTNQQEIVDLVAARDAKLAELSLEYTRRQEELSRQIKWEIAQEKIKYDQELADQAIAFDQRKTDRTTRWEQEKIDMQTQFDDRFQMYIDDMVRNQDLTRTGLEYIAKEYEAVYGKDGRVQSAIQNTLGWLSLLSEVSSNNPSFTWPSPTAPSTPVPFTWPSPTAPSTPVPTTIPWSGGGTYMPTTPFSNVPATGPGSVVIEVDLSPDLVAKVQQDTLNQVAEVIIRTGRRNAR